MPYAGPPTFLALAARTVLVDPAAAEAYLTRLRRSGAWLDQISERLRAGAGKGRLPVAPLVEQAIIWAEGVLAEPSPGAALSPRPPQGWPGAAAWEEDRRAVAEEVLKPALARWVATIKELLPQARPSERAGLVYLPGGEEDYRRAVRIYTTLPLSPEELHQTGLDHIAALEARAVQLGAGLGLSGLDEVFAAVRDSAGKIPPEEAIRQAAIAVKRAEARAAEVFPDPLPAPCDVTSMPEVVATSGAAPHYTPPRLDGGRPGTFWFNTSGPPPAPGGTSKWSPSTKRYPGTICSSPAYSCSPTCPPSSASAASPCSRRDGACTPSSSPRKPGCTPMTVPCSARSARR